MPRQLCCGVRPKITNFFLLFEKTGISVEFSEVETKHGETETITDRQSERTERDEEIRLTPARACELSEWIITQTTGIYSADAEDDRPKQSLLILLSAMAYDDDATNRENILIGVTKKVFGYSFDCDNAENQFV